MATESDFNASFVIETALESTPISLNSFVGGIQSIGGSLSPFVSSTSVHSLFHSIFSTSISSFPRLSSKNSPASVTSTSQPVATKTVFATITQFSPTNTPQRPIASAESDLSGGDKGGIAIGVIAGVFLAFWFLYYLLRRRKRREGEHQKNGLINYLPHSVVGRNDPSELEDMTNKDHSPLAELENTPLNAHESFTKVKKAELV